MEPQTADTPFHGDVLEAVTKSLGGLGIPDANNPPPNGEEVPPKGEEAPPNGEEVPPKGGEQPAPDQRPIVSTEPVKSVASRFLDPETPAPEQKTTTAQLPPDTPVEDPPDLVTEKAKNAWQELKAREKASRQYALEVKAQLEEAIKSGQLVAGERVELANGLKERDDRIKALEEELGKLTLEHKPEFREKYDVPMKDISAQVEGVLKDATDIEDPAQLAQVTESLLTASDEAFNRMVSKLPSPVQGSLLDKRRQFGQLSQARELAVNEWRTTQDGVTAEDKQRQVVEHATRRRALAEQAIEFTKVLTKPEDRLPILTETEYAADVEQADRDFRGFMQEAKDESIARAAYQGFLMPVVLRQVAYLAEAVDQWRSAYNALKGIRNPPSMAMRVQSAREEAPPPAAPVIEPGRNFKDTVENTVMATLKRGGLA